MKSKIVYILAGVCCAVLVFVFALLPQLDAVQASGGSGLKFSEVRNSQCTTSCQTYVSCGSDCDSESEDCCTAAAGEGGSCLYCEAVVVE